MLFYRFAHLVIARGSAVLWRVRVHGGEHLPQTGGYVLAPSHRSMMDIPFAAWLTPRQLRYMGKAPLFKIPVLGWLFTVLGGFPVQRDGTDRKALRDSIAMLQNGEILLVFPEGTRQYGPKIQPLQPGAAYLALRSGVPLIPVGIAGSEEIMRTPKNRPPRFHKVVMTVGAPIAPEPLAKGVVPRDKVDALSAQLSDALQVLLDEAYQIRDGQIRDGQIRDGEPRDG
jgi:1-acyl-sn-glycerol-3-phosphate acyltransferase